MCFKETHYIFRINLDTYIHNKGKTKVHQSKYKTMKNIIPGFYHPKIIIRIIPTSLFHLIGLLWSKNICYFECMMLNFCCFFFIHTFVRIRCSFIFKTGNRCSFKVISVHIFHSSIV